MSTAVNIQRRWTAEGFDVWDDVQFVERDASVGGWEQPGVEVPASWSQNATNIVAQKYFRGRKDSPERERSVRTMIDRVVVTIADWGVRQGLLGDDVEAFRDELTYVLVNQMAAFNSPVWFNVGIEDRPQCSACFILSVGDSMESLLEWQRQEGIIFKHGSGSGANLSDVRGSDEELSTGGTASGPVTFMRGTDAWAGTIKSGGKTRRAAKMVCLDDNHPDILDFVWCKAREEEKALILREAGVDMRLDSDAFASIQYQNANNSVRLTDEFMRAVANDEEWHLRARGTKTGDGEGAVIRTMRARDLFRAIAEASHRCADPGVQFDTTINRWHTCPESGRIRASNPCSEYMHVDDSACNLASINLLKFRTGPEEFDVEGFRHTVGLLMLAQEILVSASSYPTEKISRNAEDFRQLGLGYANLGAYLMAELLPYNSDDARNRAAAITSLMTGEAYRVSADLARHVGPYARYAENSDAHLNVIGMHADSNMVIQPAPGDRCTAEIQSAAEDSWRDAQDLAAEHGVRNAQVTVLAPTGTIAFLMDCDTTGIEPDYALVKRKELVGGGTMEIINGTVPEALAAVGSVGEEVQTAIAELNRTGNRTGPLLHPAFDCAGEIDPSGHVNMVASVQPFLSGAVSKTVNMPESSSVEDVEDVIMQAWRGGVKAVAIYRDGSKTAQALRAGPTPTPVAEEHGPVRRRLPEERQSITHKFSIGGHEGYITAGMYDDGRLGEIFITTGKEGSSTGGVYDAWATSISIALQYGVPLDDLARKFTRTRFEPAGRTGNTEIPVATSVPDYIMRWLASRFGDVDLQEELGCLTPAVRRRLERRERDVEAIAAEHAPAKASRIQVEGPCPKCGENMIRTGTCTACPACGESGGCG